MYGPTDRQNLQISRICGARSGSSQILFLKYKLSFQDKLHAHSFAPTPPLRYIWLVSSLNYIPSKSHITLAMILNINQAITSGAALPLHPRFYSNILTSFQKILDPPQNMLASVIVSKKLHKH